MILLILKYFICDLCIHELHYIYKISIIFFWEHITQPRFAGFEWPNGQTCCAENGPCRISPEWYMYICSPPLITVAKRHSIAMTTKLLCMKIMILKFNCTCYDLWIDHSMSLELERKDGSLVTPMALAHPLHPIRSRSKNKRWDPWDGRCVSSWWLEVWSRSSIYINTQVSNDRCILKYGFRLSETR